MMGPAIIRNSGKGARSSGWVRNSILHPELSFPLSSTTPLSTLEKQSQNHMTIITVFNHMIKTSSYLLTIRNSSHLFPSVFFTWGKARGVPDEMLTACPELSFLLRYTPCCNLPYRVVGPCRSLQRPARTDNSVETCKDRQLCMGDCNMECSVAGTTTLDRECMIHCILHFVYHVIVFNFYFRKIVLQEVGGKSFLREN